MLVTGASGFVGRPLCAELLRLGYPVRAVLRSPASFNVAGCEVIKLSSIGPDTDWTDALNGITTVIHLAARVHVMRDDAGNPLEEFCRMNVAGAERLARAAAASGVRRMVYVSTIKVNGEQTRATLPFTELDKPDPQDPYAISKWQAEQTLQRVAQETGLEVVIVRPPLVYGPGVKGNFISLLAAIDRGIPLPLAGANNARSLLYVGNLGDALITCATHPAAAGQTYLVSDGEDVSTALLIKMISQALGRSDRSFHFPPGLLRAAAALIGRTKQAERLLGSLCVNSHKIHNELNWAPPYSLEQGLRATADWYRALHNGYNRTTS